MHRRMIAALAMAAVAALAACGPERNEETATEQAPIVLVDDAAEAYGIALIVSAGYTAHVVSCQKTVQETFFCGDLRAGRMFGHLGMQVLATAANYASAVSHMLPDILASLDTERRTGTRNLVDATREVITSLARANLARPAQVTISDLEDLRARTNYIHDVEKAIGTEKGKLPCEVVRYTTTVARKDAPDASWMGNRTLAVYVKAPPGLAENGAKIACQWLDGTFFRLGSGFAGKRRPASVSHACKKDVDHKWIPEGSSDMACPSLRICIEHGTSPDCVDIIKPE